MLVLCPLPRPAHPFDLRIPDDPQSRFQNLVSVGKIKDDITPIPLWKCVLVKSHAFGTREFHCYPIIFEEDLVISRGGLLGLVQESRTIARFRIFCTSSFEFQRTERWHQEDISIIRHPGPAQMRVTEAIDHIIRYVIPGAAIPTRQPCIRAQLNHAKRKAGSRISMAMPASADKGIDEFGKRHFRLRNARKEPHNKRKKGQSQKFL